MAVEIIVQTPGVDGELDHNMRNMQRQCLSVLGAVLVIVALAVGFPSAQTADTLSNIGLTGYVIAADGVPVSAGTIALRPPSGNRITTAIDRRGQFRIVPAVPGPHELQVIVPGQAAYRITVAVPASRTLALPIIRLSPPTYFRVKPVSGADEPIVSPRFRRMSLTITGSSLPDLPEQPVETVSDNEGFLYLGPLPVGITTLVLESPPLAPVRLQDLFVTGADPLLDGGTVTLDTGAVVHVDLVDATGAPVARHDVLLDDVRPFSPIPASRVRTNEKGRATFDRLATGQYRVRTTTTERCNGRYLPVERLVPVSGSGTLVARLVVDGSATVRISTPFGPVSTSITVAPETVESPPLPGLRSGPESKPLVPMPMMAAPGCAGHTDENGQVTLDNFPPGPARLTVPLPNSRYIRRITVPDSPDVPRVIPVTIPDGLLPVYVSSGPQKPVPGADVSWDGGGARVEGRTSPAGHALLEAVGATSGTLVVLARGHARAEEKLAGPPGTIHEVLLTATPPIPVRLRVLTAAGQPIPNAVVHLTPEHHPFDMKQIAVADGQGVVPFNDVPLGDVQLVASADGFAPAIARVAQDERAAATTVMLSPGFRAVLDVALAPEDSAHLIRVVNASGSDVTDFLDVASDRIVGAQGRVSLGPLAAGTYVIELRGARQRRQTRVQIADRDVTATIR